MARPEKDNSVSTQKSDEELTSTKFVKWENRLDPKDKMSEKILQSLRVFADGTPEDYCRWRIDYDEMVAKKSFERAENKISLIQVLLEGPARDTFNQELF